VPSVAPTAPASADGAAFAERVGAQLLAMTVVDAVDLTPSMRRIVLTADGVSTLDPHPGQDLMVSVDTRDGAAVRRRYTIRALDAERGRLTLDIGMHSSGPGARWAGAVRPGDVVEGIGPRGKVTLVPEADWHLFAGDVAFLPAAFRMAEALPPSATAIVVLAVDGPGEEVPLSIDAALTGPIWVHPGTRLADVLSELAVPDGRGQAYLGGELRLVAEMRRALEARGIPREQISPKGYWRSDAPNANHGEPPKE
jgi:NADPH-dependent ferric siderophore reductase